MDKYHELIQQAVGIICKDCDVEARQVATQIKASQASKGYWFLWYYLCDSCGKYYNDDRARRAPKDHPLYGAPQQGHGEVRVVKEADEPAWVTEIIIRQDRIIQLLEAQGNHP